MNRPASGADASGADASGADASGATEIEALVDRVSQLLHRHIGLRPEPGLRGRLRGCVRDDALRLAGSFDSYLESLESSSEALQSLLNKVTVQESAFFRHPEHFGLLAADILPTLRAPITLWSAACANGQEAFSLAMLLEELGVDGRVIGTDLSTEALQRTRGARYSTRELGELSLDRIGAHLTRDGDSWLINDTIRDRVSTFHHNLLDPIPSQVRACQVVFCRNVLIYFSPDHARAFLGRVAEAMPAASLFLGAAETIWQLSDEFETVRSGDSFSYRRRSDPAKATGPGLHAVTASHRHSSGLPRGPRPARAPVPPPARPLSAAAPPPPGPDSDIGPPELQRRAGETASAAGDVLAAVVAFRKFAYLAPHDPMAHLHLGLALDSAGDPRSAQRAYAAARHALTQADPAYLDQAIEGYTPADLVRLLDSKQQVATR